MLSIGGVEASGWARSAPEHQDEHDRRGSIKLNSICVEDSGRARSALEYQDELDLR